MRLGVRDGMGVTMKGAWSDNWSVQAEGVVGERAWYWLRLGVTAKGAPRGDFRTACARRPKNYLLLLGEEASLI